MILMWFDKKYGQSILIVSIVYSPSAVSYHGKFYVRSGSTTLELKRAAILLFGKDPQHFYTSAFIKIGKFITDSDVISSDNVEGSLFSQVDNAMDIIKTKYLISKIRYEGIYRKEDLEYPEEALREAIINAVIHRDYIGAHIQLKIYSDKLILWNDGGLPNGISIEDLKKKHFSKPRNELLAKTFFEAGLIEAWGRGTIDIVGSFKKAGLPEPEFKEEQGGFTIYFYKDVYTEENLQKMGLNERQIKTILFVKEKSKITNKDYRNICNTSERTASRDLSVMVTKDILKQVGKTGKGTEYILRRHKDDKDAIKVP